MAQILDQWGKPIQREILAAPQTSRLANLRNEFASHPSRGLTPARLAQILEDAESGSLIAQCDLFEDMEEKDAHILAEMGKRKRALLTIDWDIVAPRDASAEEKTLAAWVKEVIADIPDFEDVLLDALDAIGKGYSCQEIEWHQLGGDWLPKRIEQRPPSWFQSNRDAQNELRLRDNTARGAELIPFGWLVHTHRAKSGYIARGGLHRVLAWPYLFKNYAVRDLAEFLEIYGLPLRLGKYPSGAGDEEKVTLLKAVVGIGHDAAGIIPDGMEIEFKEAAEGTHDPYEAMMNWAEASESKAILGGTLTSQPSASGGGAFALGTVHNEVRHDLKISDARQLSGTVTRQLVYPIVVLKRGNPADPRRSPRFQFDVREIEDFKMLSEALPQLAGAGLKIPTAYAYDKLRIPKPKDGEDVLTPPPAANPFGGAGSAAARRSIERAVAALRVAPGVADKTAAATADQELIEAAPEDLAGNWEELLGPQVAALLAMAEETQDLVTFRERLAELMKAPPSEALVESLTRAAFTAQLMGRTAGEGGTIEAAEPPRRAGTAPPSLTISVDSKMHERLAEVIDRNTQSNAQFAEHLGRNMKQLGAQNRDLVQSMMRTVTAAVAKPQPPVKVSMPAEFAKTMEQQAQSTERLADAQSRQLGVWLERLIDTIGKLAQKLGPRRKTITLPDGRKFELTEEDKP